jgi:hypothetical protein
MQRPPGFKSETQRENFQAAAKVHQRGGVFSPKCGVRTRTGQVCTQIPIAEGKGRCLRHCGPDAAQAHRDAQLRQMQTGKTSPADFARAEARRARNRLTNGWKKNPALPGETIDLGVREVVFWDAARALGVDVAGLYPAQADWLRWQYQRTQVDRTADAAWTRAAGAGLRKQITDADAAMVWVRLGAVDKRTKEGRTLKAALRTGGEAFAASFGVVAPKRAQGAPVGAFRPAVGDVRVWTAPPAGGPSRRGLPDRQKQPNPAPEATPKPFGRPRVKPDTSDDLAGLMAVYWAAAPEVQRMFQAIVGETDRVAFLRALKAIVEAPDDPTARRRWDGWARALMRA